MSEICAEKLKLHYFPTLEEFQKWVRTMPLDKVLMRWEESLVELTTIFTTWDASFLQKCSGELSSYMATTEDRKKKIMAWLRTISEPPKNSYEKFVGQCTAADPYGKGDHTQRYNYYVGRLLDAPRLNFMKNKFDLLMSRPLPKGTKFTPVEPSVGPTVPRTRSVNTAERKYRKLLDGSDGLAKLKSIRKELQESLAKWQDIVNNLKHTPLLIRYCQALEGCAKDLNAFMIEHNAGRNPSKFDLSVKMSGHITFDMWNPLKKIKLLGKIGKKGKKGKGGKKPVVKNKALAKFNAARAKKIAKILFFIGVLKKKYDLIECLIDHYDAAKDKIAGLKK